MGNIVTWWNDVPYRLIADRTARLTNRQIKSRKLRWWLIVSRLFVRNRTRKILRRTVMWWHKARSRPWKPMHYSRWEIEKAGTAEVMINEKRQVPASNNSFDKNNSCIVLIREINFVLYTFNKNNGYIVCRRKLFSHSYNIQYKFKKWFTTYLIVIPLVMDLL